MFFVLFYQISAQAIVEHENHDLFNPPKIHNGSILTIQDCISLAFKNSPKIRRKKYELDIAKSKIRIAQSRYFPVISTGVGFVYERNSNDIYYDKKYRDLPNVGVAINKMVWDFGKTTALIKMEEFYKIGAEYEFMDELCHTLFDIKAKYYSLLKTIALEKIAQENVDLNIQFLNLARPDIDKTTAKVYMNSSEIKQFYADGDIDIAKLNLSNSMYLDNEINYSVKSTPTFNENSIDSIFKPLTFPFEEKDAVEIAYKNSPDIAVLSNTKKAMEESLKYIKRMPLPDISAGVGYGLNHTNYATNNSLQVGVNVSTDINLMEVKYNIDSAKSELDIADNEIELFKKDLQFEVLRALSNVDCYKQQLPKIKKEIQESKLTLDLAFKKYKENKLDYTALHDSIEDYIYAKEKYIDCLYKYNMSLIQTEMAMHYHIVDIHHKAEHAMHHHADELLEHLNDALNCNKKEKSNKKRKLK